LFQGTVDLPCEHWHLFERQFTEMPLGSAALICDLKQPGLVAKP